MGAENFPPEISEANDNTLSVCPYYQLIEIGAELAGVKITNKSFFCGTIERHEDTIGPLSGFRGTVYEPRSECTEVWKKLQEDLSVAEQKIDLLTEEELENSLGVLNLEQKRERLNEWHNLKIQKEKQDEIIARWRKIIWETSLGKIKPGKRYFGEIEKPEDLTNDQIISYAQNVLLNLWKIANRYGRGGFYMRDKGKDENVEQCPKSPQIGESGMCS